MTKIYKTLDKFYLDNNNFEYKGMYGLSQIWANDKKGLLLDKIKNSENVFNVRFSYNKGESNGKK
jgi:hypothetical protein